jgi:Na+-transporting NADH:ubiquinone oxidoreductase subunit F
LLKNHPRIQAVEFYPCGPPQTIKAGNKMLADLGVSPAQIAYGEF